MIHNIFVGLRPEAPKRQHRGDYKDTDYPFRLIPEVF
jgi:hypothetical protein